MRRKMNELIICWYGDLWDLAWRLARGYDMASCKKSSANDICTTQLRMILPRRRFSRR